MTKLTINPILSAKLGFTVYARSANQDDINAQVDTFKWGLRNGYRVNSEVLRLREVYAPGDAMIQYSKL